ncbi:helix-turn-helix domain-containing protein [Streptomyces sp. KS_5]|uniref:winged helix-turn-helix transcriptional regulator n=1 Tax=Streptomyces sp. KS_5 TaxID=1881018 RepID=UPI0008969F51|nr:winged helix-turn-helix transcriptional regulator [Streptomyces sp. KS_5]SEE35304.1 transcriptional regulator, HxlR family [Streptomyces sp. KS_5]
MTRSYQQRCYIARALDVLGERWTFLILRELALGPRRYSEILASLPGIGTSLLASRLKHLEAHGVVRRTTPTGAGRIAGYELAERGIVLMPVLASLAEWGADVEETSPEYADRTSWRLVAMRLTAPQDAAQFNALTQLVVDDEVFWLIGDGEQAQVHRGIAPLRPDLRLLCNRDTLTLLAKGRVSVEDAMAAGDLVVEGEPGDAQAFFDVFTLPGARDQSTSK